MKSSFSIAKSTYAWVWVAKILILKALFPILLICLVAVYFESMPLIFISFILGFYYTATIMVQVHRTIISGISTDHIRLFPKIEKTFFLYLAVWFFLNAVETFVEKTIAKMPFGIEITLGLIGLYVITRAYLIFPILAVKNKLDFRFAFYLSKDKFWLIFNSILLMTLPLIIFIMAIGGLIFLVFSGLIFLVFSDLNSDNFGMVFGIGIYFVAFTTINIHYSVLFLELSKDQKKPNTQQV